MTHNNRFILTIKEIIVFKRNEIIVFKRNDQKSLLSYHEISKTILKIKNLIIFFIVIAIIISLFDCITLFQLPSIHQYKKGI